MKTMIRQEIALSDRRVVGYFKYRELFQVIPIPSNAPSLEFPIGHHPFLIEFRYDVPDISETNYNPEIPSHALLPMIDLEASTRPRNEVFLLLSTLSRNWVFQYNSSHTNQQWFVKLPMNSRDVTMSPDSIWGQAGYQCLQLPAQVMDNYSNIEATAIRLLEKNEY